VCDFYVCKCAYMYMVHRINNNTDEMKTNYKTEHFCDTVMLSMQWIMKTRGKSDIFELKIVSIKCRILYTKCFITSSSANIEPSQQWKNLILTTIHVSTHTANKDRYWAV